MSMTSSVSTVSLQHAHWRGQVDAPDVVHVTVGVYITLVGLIAMCCNTLVVITCVRYQLPAYLPVYLSACLPNSLPACLPVYLPV